MGSATTTTTTTLPAVSGRVPTTAVVATVPPQAVVSGRVATTTAVATVPPPLPVRHLPQHRRRSRSGSRTRSRSWSAVGRVGGRHRRGFSARLARRVPEPAASGRRARRARRRARRGAHPNEYIPRLLRIDICTCIAHRLNRVAQQPLRCKLPVLINSLGAHRRRLFPDDGERRCAARAARGRGGGGAACTGDVRAAPLEPGQNPPPRQAAPRQPAQRRPAQRQPAQRQPTRAAPTRHLASVRARIPQGATG